MGGVFGVAIIIFTLFFIFSGKTNFIFNGEENKNSLSVESKTVADLVKADTDLDGVPDWEEALWGTDKNKKITFGDTPDGTYIANRKKEMNAEQEKVLSEENLTETEEFAREFFASFAALKASGEVDANTINNFSSALGKKLVNPILEDIYEEEDAKIKESEDYSSKRTYYFSVKAVFDKYKKDGLGKELGTVSETLASSGNASEGISESNEELLIIGQAYKSFAEEMMKVEVPKSLLEYHLKIANSANNTGQSVLNMQKMINDPIVGLSGLSQYQKYSAELIAIVAILEEALAKEQ